MKNKVIVGDKISLIEIYRPSDGLYYYVIVDTQELEWMTEQVRTVCINAERRTEYAIAWLENRTFKALHRLIMNTPKGLEVHHINHYGLDNRKVNLANLDSITHKSFRRKRLDRGEAI